MNMIALQEGSSFISVFLLHVIIFGILQLGENRDSDLWTVLPCMLIKEFSIAQALLDRAFYFLLILCHLRII